MRKSVIIAIIIALILITVGISCYFYFFDTEIKTRIIVEIPNGKLKGYQLQNIHAFESIPYAEPPIGEARFEPPKPFTSKWDGVRDAKGKPEKCMQYAELPSEDGNYLFGVEDCLYLNVYSPNVESDDKLYPVLIHIHGGAFMHGSSKSYNPYLVQRGRNFVYVTINYRLGPLGFIGTEDEQIPGNMGLKDQHLAIKWVKENIKAFKGDPEQIIISGFSAGGASVHYHTLSKKSEGLFKVGVSHSGSALCSWAHITNPLMRTKKLAAHVGCPTSSTKEMKDCLKKKDAKDIVNAVREFLIFLNNPFTVFGPVVEPKTSKEPFLVEDIESLIKQGKSSKIPWLVTYTVDDGAYNAAYLVEKDKNGVEFIEQLDDQWEKVAPLMLFFNESVPAYKHAETANYYKTKYLGDQKISRNTYWQFQKMCTDRFFIDGIQHSVNLHRNYSESPVYVYAFDHPPLINLGQKLSKRDDVYFGTGHGDDVYLIFATDFIRSPDTFSPVEQVISLKLICMYESFIKTGVPKYGDVEIPKNIPNSSDIKLLRIKGTETILESTTQLE